jgi:membrane protease YdiL (CAAX protease family)
MSKKTEAERMNIPVKAILFYALTFIFTILLGGLQQALGIGSWIILPQLSPALAALILLAFSRKENRKLTITVKANQTSKYIGAVAIPLLVSAVLFLIYGHFVGPIGVPALGTFSALTLYFGILIGALGEEIGWRGYLQPLFESRVNLLSASLLVGVLWGLWHVGNYHYGVAYMSFFVLSTIGYSVIVAWLYRGTNYNVLIAFLFHFAVNFGFLILTNAINDLRFMIMNGTSWIIVAATFFALRRRDFRAKR